MNRIAYFPYTKNGTASTLSGNPTITGVSVNTSTCATESLSLGAIFNPLPGLYAVPVLDVDLAIYDYVITAVTTDDVDTKRLYALWSQFGAQSQLAAPTAAENAAALTESAWAGNVTSGMTTLANVATGTGTATAFTGQALINTPPSQTTVDTSAIADAVWNRLTSAITTANSVGKYVLDTLAAIVAKTGLITTGKVTVQSPLSLDGLTLTTVRGDDYTINAGQALEWTDGGDTWPILTDAVITFTTRTTVGDAIGATQTGSVVTATGTGKKVRVELASAKTSLLAPGGEGYKFDVQATLANGSIRTLVRGSHVVLEDQTR